MQMHPDAFIFTIKHHVKYNEYVVNVDPEHSHRCLCLQASLTKLMETLDQSEPYFVKCIRSNAEKVNSAVPALCIQ